jgi:flagellar hook protein FlgE
MDFEDQLSQSLANGSNPMQIGEGVATAAINSDFTQGTINTTGNPTDLAISGDGFFVVKDPSSGASYVTRDGQFNLDANGFLVTANGDRVQGFTGSSTSTIGDLQINNATAIAALNDTTTPAPTITSYSINAAGQINASLSDNTSGVIGQIVLQNFTNPQGLMKEGENLYTYSATAGPLAAPVAPNSAGLGKIQSFAVESSNVDLATQMADLITAQRSFEANAKIVTTSDEILQDLINLKR